MRVSTNMIYDRGVATIQRQTADLLKTQQQVSSGRRILTPADDPIGAARALEITQSKAINNQFVTNQGYAEDNLKLLENRLTGVGEVLQYVRGRTIQAGNAALSQTELNFIAIDLRAQYDAMVGLANSQDANNEFLFAGYKSQTRPFQGGFGAVNYAGDEGARTIQVSGSRFMPVSFPGSDVFSRTRPLGDDLVVAEASSANTGGATVSGGLAAGFATTPGAEQYLGRRLEIVFNGTDFDVTEYLPGIAAPNFVGTVASLAQLADPADPAYRGVDVQLNPAAAVAAGDRFEVFVGSTDMFANLAVFVDALERPGPSGMAGGAVGFALQTLDAGLDNVLRVRAQIGSQLVEVDNLRNVGEDLDIQYATTLSRLQDVDFAEAISRLTRQQTFLEAAQASFVRVTGLSLFNFIN